MGARLLQCGAVGSGTDTRRGGTGRSVGAVACGRLESGFFFSSGYERAIGEGENWTNQRLSFSLPVELGSCINQDTNVELLFTVMRLNWPNRE